MGLKRVLASFGGGFGVVGIILTKLFHVTSRFIRYLLWPSSILTSTYQGSHPWTAGVLVALVDFAGNVAIYALIGFAVGSLIEIAQSRRIND